MAITGDMVNWADVIQFVLFPLITLFLALVICVCYLGVTGMGTVLHNRNARRKFYTHDNWR